MRKKRKQKKRYSRIFCGLLGIFTIIAVTYFQLRPAVENAAAYHVNIFATRILNNAILEELSNQGLSYGELIRLSRNQSGEIVAIESDMAEINRLKANVTLSVVDALEDMGTARLFVPLGTLFGNEITSGRGPIVEILVYPIGFVQTDLYSQFTEAGINQTMHQIMLGTSVRMRAIIPGYTIQTEITTSYTVAETIIVGNIPDAYTRISLGAAPVIAHVGGIENPPQ